MDLTFAEIITATIATIYFTQGTVSRKFLEIKNQLLEIQSKCDKRDDELESFCRRNEAMILLKDKNKTINIEIKGVSSHNAEEQREPETDFIDM